MVRRLLAAAALIAAALMPARLDAAACHSEIAQQEPRRAPIVKVGWMKRAAADPGEVGLTFLGHASFLIESPQGVTIVTDYNDYLRAPFAPDIATMNLAHSTHYSENPEKGIKYLLRGWDERGGVAQHELTYKDVRVTSIPTNIRDFGGGTRRAGNSIFAFQVEGICVVHLGHLHHTLTPKHLADLGKVDVLLAAVDGTWTMGHEDMVQTINDIKPTMVVPMHYFGSTVLETFLARLAWPVRHSRVSAITMTRATLPEPPEVLVLPGR